MCGSFGHFGSLIFSGYICVCLFYRIAGDTKLSRAEIAKTHILVATPEKWDVMTRKSGSSSLEHSRLSILQLRMIESEK
jgi:hypothetical protein